MADHIGQQLGNYLITRSIGRGGFAEVFLGEHIYLKTQVAIKMLKTAVANKQDLDGFLTEAQTIAHLVHPNIVRVMDYGVDNETPFLVMDYAPNGSLRDLHPRGTQLPLATVTIYIKQVAAALQHAHNEKLIHRDIKPENMLVGRYNDILLSDFGIALIAQSSRNQSTQDVIGTVAYMSPEQIQGKPRPASDQYSLAIVAYEWLSGDRPFHGSFTEMCSQHIFASPPSLHEKVPTLSSDVEQVVMTALAKDPKDRFASIQAFANALEQANHSAQITVAKAQPILAPTPQPPIAASFVTLPPLATDTEQTIDTEENKPTEMVTSPVNAPPTDTEENKPTEMVTSPVNTPQPSPLPPTEKAAPASRFPASIPPPSPILTQRRESPDPLPLRAATTASPPTGTKPSRRTPLIAIAGLGALVVLILAVVLVVPAIRLKAPVVTPSPTATTHVNGTPVPTATVNLATLSPQQLYTTVTAAPLTLSDPLNAQDQNQWDQNAGCAFTGGMYHVITTAADHYTPCMAKNTNFKNLAYQVQIARLSGIGGGLIFRSDQAVRMYYRFSLDNQGLYKLFICQQCNNANGGGTSLVQASTPNTAQSNTLTVIANNNALYLYINGTFIKQVNDATASSGEIGLYGFSTSEVSFSNLKVWRLP